MIDNDQRWLVPVGYISVLVTLVVALLGLGLFVGPEVLGVVIGGFVLAGVQLVFTMILHWMFIKGVFN